MKYKADKIIGKSWKYSSILLLLSISIFTACHNQEPENHTVATAHNHDEHQHTGSLWEKIFHNHDDEHDHSGHNHGTENEDAHDENDTSIFISKKKQQTLGIEVASVGKAANSISSSIQFSGKTSRSASDHWEVIAPVDGQITFSKNFNLGDMVSSGINLFSISGKNFTEGNVERDKAQINAQILEAEAALNLAKVDFERAEKAIEFQVISKDKFEHTKATLEQAKIKLTALQQQLASVGQKYGNNSQIVSATKTGIIEELNIKNGSFVSAGTSVIGFSSNKDLVASFQVPNNKVETLKASQNAQLIINGKAENISNFGEQMKVLVANGTQVGYNTIQIPIPKSLKTTAGALASIEITETSENTELSVPKTAVLEDFGLYYCYVEVTKDHFEQRPLEIKDRSATSVRINSGLKIGEKIVTKNPLQVKFSGVAAVGHSHDH